LLKGLEDSARRHQRRDVSILKSAESFKNKKAKESSKVINGGTRWEKIGSPQGQSGKKILEILGQSHKARKQEIKLPVHRGTNSLDFCKTITTVLPRKTSLHVEMPY